MSTEIPANVRATLDKFARHTRQSPDEHADLTRLARKWMTLHTARAAEAPRLYSWIGNDYAWLAARTQNPPLAQYAETNIHVPTFVWIAQHGHDMHDARRMVDEDVGPQYRAFCNSLFPQPANQEPWQRYTGNAHWKPRAYYMALRCHARPQFRTLVEAIHNADLPAEVVQTQANKDAVTDLFSTMINHVARNCGGVFPTADDSTEMGAKLIGGLDLSHIECATCGGRDKGASSSSSSDNESGGEESGGFQELGAQAPLVFSPHKEVPPQASAEHHAVIHGYRKRAGLPATFPVAKVVKQMVLAGVGQAAGAPPPAEIAARMQDKLAPLADHDEWQIALVALSAFPEAQGHVDALHAAAAEPNSSLREMHTHLAGEPSTRELVCAMLNVYGGTHLEAELPAAERAWRTRFRKKYPVIQESVIKVLLSL